MTEEEQRLLLYCQTQPAWAGAASMSDAWRGGSVREQSGRLTDGRHFKRYWLVPPPAAQPGGGGSEVERLVVAGVDSSRRDRRYKYVAVGDAASGGAAVAAAEAAAASSTAFVFDNVQEVVAYVGHLLGRQPEGRIPDHYLANSRSGKASLAPGRSAGPKGPAPLRGAFLF